MQPLHRRIVEVLRARRDGYVRLFEAFIDEKPASVRAMYGRAEAEQMVDGFIAMFVEALDGGGGEVRSFYLETAVSSIRERGRPAPVVVASAVRYFMLVAGDASFHVPAEDREAVLDWFAVFCGELVADMTGVLRGGWR